jgi:hypothetical protein
MAWIRRFHSRAPGCSLLTAEGVGHFGKIHPPGKDNRSTLSHWVVRRKGISMWLKAHTVQSKSSALSPRGLEANCCTFSFLFQMGTAATIKIVNIC